MTVKIITDTLSDIDGDLIDELGVTLVPLYVRFGEDIYRDRVDITAEDFYRRLLDASVLPSTTQPTPKDFIDVFEKLDKETDEILVITISSKLSGTYQSAIQAKDMYQGKCRIEVVDSLAVAMSQGLVVIAAVEAVRAGADLDKAVSVARSAASRSHLIAYFDTLKYLAKGGRIGKAEGMLGSLLSVKPILTVKEGEMAPLTRVRSVNAGLDYMCKLVSELPGVEGIAVEYSTTPEAAETLDQRLKELFPDKRIYRAIISPVVGTYGGPGAFALSFLEAEKK